MTHSVPQVTFKTRVRDENVEGPNPFRWQDVQTDEIFAGKENRSFRLARRVHTNMLKHPFARL